jgi:hypothetical protein
MLFAQSERNMFDRHSASVSRGPPGDLTPKSRNLFDVRGPVLDLAVEDRAEKLVLSHIGIKVPQQTFDHRPSAESLK